MQVSTLARQDFYTTQLPGDDYLWTAGFFNERFPDAVSPLGWSVMRRLVEGTAFREPLAFIGYRLPPDFPLTKLYRGHVYTNVGVFQRLYRVFPSFLVPRDAGRYFPHADVSLRYAVPRPNLTRFLLAVTRTVTSEAGWHPFNYVIWERFRDRFDRGVMACLHEIAADTRPHALLQQVERLMALSMEFLRLHRWSLTYADVLYDLLQRAVAAWIDAPAARVLSAELCSGLPNKSTETDLALWRLSQLAAGLDAAMLDRLHTEDWGALRGRLKTTRAGRCFQEAFDDFLEHYGHRSPSLDLRYPAYADDPKQVLALVTRFLEDANAGPAVREQTQEQRRRAAIHQAHRILRGPPGTRRAFDMLLALTHRYTILREDQRFYWQKCLHAMRRAFIYIGRSWAAEGWLAKSEDVFFLLLTELSDRIQHANRTLEIANLASDRRTQFEVLRGSTYPAFLRGNSPVGDAPCPDGGDLGQLSGLPTSPGRARGPALVVQGPAALEDAWRRLSSSSILVTSSTDPAWTPLFLHISGLIMASGGQLSHGAVVAREYGLPAVVGVAGALEHIADGALVEVDGNTGTVTLLDQRET